MIAQPIADIFRLKLNTHVNCTNQKIVYLFGLHSFPEIHEHKSRRALDMALFDAIYSSVAKFRKPDVHCIGKSIAYSVPMQQQR